MRVLQLSDLHLGPTDDPIPRRAEANRRAWANAERTARALRALPDADDVVTVVTGDLTDDAYHHPDHLVPAAELLATFPGTVLCLPGNHDVGNFTAAPYALPTVSEALCRTWENAVGPDRFRLARDGHRLLGLNSMILGSGLPRESDQDRWLIDQLRQAHAADESVWVFQHAPFYLRTPHEVRTERELYWCPPPAARDRVLGLLNHPAVRGVASGHVHRRYDHAHAFAAPGPPPHVRWCPALSGTHTDADYFPPHPAAGTHALSFLHLTPEGQEHTWEPTGLEMTTRRPG